MLLEAVYEQDFLDCSYGFRPGRSAHQALTTLRDTLMEMGGGWVIEVDIREYFGSIDHQHLRQALSRRIGDGVVLRLIGKWLNAGGMEMGGGLVIEVDIREYFGSIDHQHLREALSRRIGDGVV